MFLNITSDATFKLNFINKLGKQQQNATIKKSKDNETY